MNENDLIPYAVVDHMHLMVKELFQSLPKAKRNQRMQFVTQYGDNLEIEIRGFAQLGAFELALLQAVIGMAGTNQIPLEINPPGVKGKELRQKLELQADAVYERSMVVHTSYRRLLAEIGKKYTGNMAKQVQTALLDLGSTFFIVRQRKPRKMFGFNVISAVSATDDTMTIALNPFLASAIVGDRNYARVYLSEARKIKSDAGKLLHSRLSALIHTGGERAFKPETLVTYIWPDEASPATQRKRLSRLNKNILPELQKIGWGVYPTGETVRIRRASPKPVPTQLSLLDI